MSQLPDLFQPFLNARRRSGRPLSLHTKRKYHYDLLPYQHHLPGPAPAPWNRNRPQRRHTNRPDRPPPQRQRRSVPQFLLRSRRRRSHCRRIPNRRELNPMTLEVSPVSALSRLKPEFESPWGHNSPYYSIGKVQFSGSQVGYAPQQCPAWLLLSVGHVLPFPTCIKAS